MKNIFLTLITVTMLFSNSALTLTDDEKAYLKNKGVITMCVDPDWEPFEIINKNGKHEGISADLIQLISEKIGTKIKLVKTKNWDETLEFSKAKKCDILSFLNDTPQRREWLTFTKPIFSDPNVLVGRIERNYIDDIGKENLSIALPKGTAMAERFANDFPNLTIIPTNSEAEAFQFVEDRKADITLRSLIVTAFTIKKEGLFNLKIIGEPKGYENNLCIGVLKDEPILKDILNAGIAQLTKKDLDTIVNNHVNIVIKKVTYFTMALWGFIVIVIISIIVLLWNYSLRQRVALEIQNNLNQKELILEQKRKAELGELIANISHQWKNGLANISGINLYLMMMCDTRETISTKELKKFNKEIETSIKFMSQTIEVFLNFYKDKKQYDTFCVIDSIKNAMLFVDIPLKTNNAKIDIIENESLFIEANKNEWIHIWLNLLNNTINAAIKKNINQLNVVITIENNKIIYQDNCLGFEKDMLEEIQNNKFTGLGLKMSSDILLKYGWKMVVSNNNEGSLFILSIEPLANSKK